MSEEESIRVDEFLKMWSQKTKPGTVKQKDQMGITWLTKIVGISEEEVEKFLSGDLEVHTKVGEIHGGLKEGMDDFPGFWTEINNIFPNLHTSEDLEFLINPGGEKAALHFMYETEPLGRAHSSIVRQIYDNMHEFK